MFFLKFFFLISVFVFLTAAYAIGETSATDAILRQTALINMAFSDFKEKDMIYSWVAVGIVSVLGGGALAAFAKGVHTIAQDSSRMVGQLAKTAAFLGVGAGVSALKTAGAAAAKAAAAGQEAVRQSGASLDFASFSTGPLQKTGITGQWRSGTGESNNFSGLDGLRNAQSGQVDNIMMDKSKIDISNATVAMNKIGKEGNIFIRGDHGGYAGYQKVGDSLFKDLKTNSTITQDRLLRHYYPPASI